MKKKLIGFFVATVLSSAANAGTFDVTRMDDPVPDGCKANDCSLREAVIDADQTTAEDTIVLPAGVYLIDFLTPPIDGSENTGDLDISTDMVIAGAPSIIDGQDLGRIIEIRSGANVTLRDLNLRNANSSLANNNTLNGGALMISGGNLTLDAVTFENNSTQTLGGAIYARDDAVVNIDGCLFVDNNAGSGAAIMSSGKVTVRNTDFQGNSASRGGAAYLDGTTSDSRFEGVTFDQNIATDSGGAIRFFGRELFIDSLIATNNEATGGAGGVLAVSGTNHTKQVEIVNATFDDNMADDGGAISFEGSSDTLDIRHSSFVNNKATGWGGAVNLTGGKVVVTNSTFSGNQTSDIGGAIQLFGAELTLHHTTFSGGSADRGDALYVGGSSAISSAELANNLIDGDCEISDADSVTSLGGNVEGTGDRCGLDAGSDLVNQSSGQLGLQPLRENAGATPTHELTSGSVARGQGEPAICELVKIDQLFMRRGDPCNSGAVESETIFRDGFESS